MTKSIRYGTYLREVTLRQQTFSANALAVASASEGPAESRLQLRRIDVLRLVRPYLSVRFNEQLRAVLPLVLYLAAFQLFILQQQIVGPSAIIAGIAATIIGLMLFMEGLKVGLMPFGESIGHSLPQKSSLPVVMLVVLLLGIGVTYAEPAIGALKLAGSNVKASESPVLYALLHQYSTTLVLMVGLGVGLSAVLGVLRFLYNWNLRPMLFLLVPPTLLLSLWMGQYETLRGVISLAWDCGGVTTGPVTVPLVLSLGIGISSAVGKQGDSLEGFGIVTLASLFPVLAVLSLGLYVANTHTPAELMLAEFELAALQTPPWHEQSPWLDIISGVRAIVPLVLFLLLVLYGLLKERLRNISHTCYGIVLSIVGMVIFNLGLSYGLSSLGGQAGSLTPAAFTMIPAVMDSPIFSNFVFGALVAAFFAWVLGFGATVAEPALNAMGNTVELLTNGACKKGYLMVAVAIGVGAGLMLGVLMLVFHIPLLWLLVPGYTIALALTALVSEEFTNIAWDSAGVTTGPVTVPLVLALGLGFGQALGNNEAFGLLALASVAPIIAVLAMALWIEQQVKRRHQLADLAEASGEVVHGTP